MIFDDISAELLFTPSLPAGVEDPQSLPAVTPAPLGVGDNLVERTWNGLRPDDAALPQPPQDPEWRPDGDS